MMQESGPLGGEKDMTIVPSVIADGLFPDIPVSEGRTGLAPRHRRDSDERLLHLRRIGVSLGLTAITLGLAGSAEQPSQTTTSEAGIIAEAPHLSEQQVIDDAMKEHAAKVAAAEAYQKTPAYEQQILKKEIAERRAKIEAGPPELDPTSFSVGEALGAFIIEPAPLDTSSVQLTSAELASCKAGGVLPEAKMAVCFATERADYFSSIQQANPPVNPILVHRFTAVDAATGDQYLANGPVLLNNSTKELMVVALHNITPIVGAPVAYDGKTYNQTLMGINTFLPEGSTVKMVMPSDIPGYVAEYAYTRTSFTIVDTTNPTAAAQAIYAPAEGTALRTYQCWTPGGSRYRLVYSFAFAGSQLVPGSAYEVGETLKTAPHQG